MRTRKNQQGITLIGAIFIMVVIGMLGQFLVNITASQRQTTLMALQSARAYQAANAGVELAIAQVVNNNNCVPSTTFIPPNSFFNVNVTCQNSGTFTEDTKLTTVFQIRSQSEFNSFGEANYVSRTVEATIQR